MTQEERERLKKAMLEFCVERLSSDDWYEDIHMRAIEGELAALPRIIELLIAMGGEE
jgi:hypothetical protein